MVFSSVLFLAVFLPLFLFVFYLSPKPLKKWVILLFSILFYAWGAPIFTFFLMGSSILDFWFTSQFEGAKRKLYLTLSIALNTGLLLYFKYFNFFIDNINSALLQFEIAGITAAEVVLPIGISFFTFQKISYSVDVYSHRNPPLKRFDDYLLFIIMFPQLIAGPIVRYTDVSTQILNYRNNTLPQRTHGLYRFIIGLAKKVLLANTFAAVVVQIEGLGLDSISTVTAWQLALAYTLQIYFDFSGYSDMAIGLGQMMGFNFPENFNFPYLSKSITEFWQRWHITLGTWMRNYLYIPLGGNKVSPSKTYVNLLTVFFISGFWHGANWNFIVWGLYHGAFLILERFIGLNKFQKAPAVIQWVYTLLVVMVGWIFFNYAISDAWVLIQKMWTFTAGNSTIIDFKAMVMAGLGIVFSLMGFTPKINARLNNFYNWALSGNFIKVTVVYLLMLLLLVICFLDVVTSGFNPFIYYRF
jgi:alginate O-acetyltransferase complex protein AlgI